MSLLHSLPVPAASPHAVQPVCDDALLLTHEQQQLGPLLFLPSPFLLILPPSLHRNCWMRMMIGLIHPPPVRTRNCCAKRWRKDVLVARADMGIGPGECLSLCGGRCRDASCERSMGELKERDRQATESNCKKQQPSTLTLRNCPRSRAKRKAYVHAAVCLLVAPKFSRGCSAPSLFLLCPWYLGAATWDDLAPHY